MDTVTGVRNVVAKVMNIDADRITLETSLEHDLAADSLDRVEIILGLEETFEIAFDDEGPAATTIREIVEQVDAMRGVAV